MHITQKKQNVQIYAHYFSHELIDNDALDIIHKLNKFGYLAYLVGGCVRDLLLGYQAKDFDIVTSARPREIQQLFKNARIIGRRFQLVHIKMSNKDPIEVSTFRRPPMSSAHEGALIVDDNEFGTAQTDAKRRDFTINALFYDPVRHKIYDYCQGVRDIEHTTLRSIGDPIIRFREDPIRMLRAIKFMARLNLTCEKKMHHALSSERLELQKVAPPRLLQEMTRMLQGKASARSYELLLSYGFLPLLAPEIVAAFLHDDYIKQSCFQLLRRLDEAHFEHTWNEGNLIALPFVPMFQSLSIQYDFKNQQSLWIKRLLAPFANRVGMPFKTLKKMGHFINMQLKFDRDPNHFFNLMPTLDVLCGLQLRSFNEKWILEYQEKIDQAMMEHADIHQADAEYDSSSKQKVRRKNTQKNTQKNTPKKQSTQASDVKTKNKRNSRNKNKNKKRKGYIR